MEKQYMKMRELEEKSGVPRSTIHFYVRQGLLASPVKKGKTVAYYDQAHLTGLKQIEFMKNVKNFSINAIRKMMADQEPWTEAGQDVPREDPYERRRREFIAAALRIFSAKGYRKTSIRDITGEVGLSAGAFYCYFPDKRALFLEAIDEAFHRIQEQTMKSLAGETDFMRRMFFRGKTFYQYYSRYSDIFYQLRAQMNEEADWPRQKLQEIYRGLTDPVAQEISDAIETGAIREVDARLLSYALTGLIEIMATFLTFNREYTIDQVMGFLADLLGRGLLPEGGGADT